MRDWAGDGVSKAEIMRRTGRSKDCVDLHLARSAMKVGRKKTITPAVLRKLKASKTKLQRKVKAKKEVTVAMIKDEAGVDACDRVVLDAFHAEDIYFRPLRQRPILTDEDIEKRWEWGEKFERRSSERWVEDPDAIIDNKHFPFFITHAGRAEGARRMVRGGYRARGDGPQTWLVRQKPSQKFPVTGVQVTAAIVGGKIRMWRYVNGSWCGREAVGMYKDLKKVLEKHNPEKAARPNHRWVVLEDNDPAGYKSSAGRQAKRDCKMKSLDLPPRSPDLNPLDYSIWREINGRMRSQEAEMGANRRESKEAFQKRLRRVALSLPQSVVEKAVKDMRRRVKEVLKAKGGLFTESK